MNDTIKTLAKISRKLKPGQRLILTLPKSYYLYDLELLKNQIAEYAKLYSNCFTIGIETASAPTDAEGIEMVTDTKVILVRTDAMSALPQGRHKWYAGQWIIDFSEYCELADTITDPEPNEIPKFHL